MELGGFSWREFDDGMVVYPRYGYLRYLWSGVVCYIIRVRVHAKIDIRAEMNANILAKTERLLDTLPPYTVVPLSELDLTNHRCTA